MNQRTNPREPWSWSAHPYPFNCKHLQLNPPFFNYFETIQLTEDGAITEPGQNAQMIAEEEHKQEPGLVQTQLQLMVVLIVLGKRLKVRVATSIDRSDKGGPCRSSPCFQLY